MLSAIERIEQIGIVPVVAIPDAKDAVALGKALIDGGIPCAEITFRTAAGEQAIRNIARALPDMLLGAGTVLSADQADRAIDAGASFVVSPGFNPKVVDHCIAKGIPVLPGCATPSEMEQALERGLGAVKFFPAEPAGGLDYLRAVSGPYPSLRFMPTGGIGEDNLNRYLSFERVIACGGSWMVQKELIAAKDFATITARSKTAVARMLGLRLDRVDINAASEPATSEVRAIFEALFGLESDTGPVGVVNEMSRGKYGTISVAANSAFRARAHLAQRGIFFDEASAEYGEDNRLSAIFLKDEIAGFAVRLIQK